MKRNGIVKDTATLMGGNVLAQAIALAAYFVLTRIYSPADYGLFNIFYSYIEVLVIVSTCKYELAAVVAGSDREAAAVSRFAMRINATVSSVLLALALILWTTGLLPSNLPEIGWMVLLIPPMVFFCGTSRIYSFLYNRFHRYTDIALSENINAAGGAVAKGALGLLGVAPSGLPIGAVVGQAAANIGYRLRLRKLHLPDTTRDERTAAARQHRNFPLYVATKDFVNSFSANLPFLWGAAYFDRVEIGLFGLALTFARQPVQIISNAIERVFYARCSDAVHERQTIKPLIIRFAAIANTISIPLCIAAWFLAEPLFSFGFGSRWSGCGVYVRAIIPWIWIMLTANSLMFVSNIFSTQRTEFFFQLAQFALRIGAIAIGIASADFLLTVHLFAGASAAVCLGLTAWYLWQVFRYERSIKA